MLGSSLVVQPAAALPVVAAQAGAHVVIVNRDETPLDGLAAVVIHGPVEEVVPALAERLTGTRGRGGCRIDPKLDDRPGPGCGHGLGGLAAVARARAGRAGRPGSARIVAEGAHARMEGERRPRPRLAGRGRRSRVRVRARGRRRGRLGLRPGDGPALVAPGVRGALHDELRRHGPWARAQVDAGAGERTPVHLRDLGHALLLRCGVGQARLAAHVRGPAQGDLARLRLRAVSPAGPGPARGPRRRRRGRRAARAWTRPRAPRAGRSRDAGPRTRLRSWPSWTACGSTWCRRSRT